METTPDHMDETVNECVLICRMTKVCLNCTKYRVNIIKIGHSIRVLDTAGLEKEEIEGISGKPFLL